MTLRSLTTAENEAGAGFGAVDGVGIHSVLKELQGLSISIIAGFAAGVSGALTDSAGNSASGGGGDTLLSCIALPTASNLAVDLTGSASISGDRVLIADTGSTGQKLQVTWYNRDGA